MANIQILNHNDIIECLESYLKSTHDCIKLLEKSILKHKSNTSSPSVIDPFSHSLVLLKAEKDWGYDFMVCY